MPSHKSSQSIKCRYHFWSIYYLPEKTLRTVSKRISQSVNATNEILRALKPGYRTCGDTGNMEDIIYNCLKEHQNEMGCCYDYFCPNYVFHFPSESDGWAYTCLTIGGLHYLCLQQGAFTAARCIQENRQKIESKFVRAKYGNPLLFCVRSLKKSIRPSRVIKTGDVLKICVQEIDVNGTRQLQEQLNRIRETIKFEVRDSLDEINETDKYVIMIAIQREDLSDVRFGMLEHILPDEPFFTEMHAPENCYGVLVVETCEIENDNDNRLHEFYAHVFRNQHPERGFGQDFEVFCLKEAIMKYAFLAGHSLRDDGE